MTDDATAGSPQARRPNWIRRHVIGLRRVTWVVAAIAIVMFFGALVPSATYTLQFGPGTAILLGLIASGSLVIRWLLSEFFLGILGLKYPGFKEMASIPASREVHPELYLKYYFELEDAGLTEHFPGAISTLLDPTSSIVRVSEQLQLDGRRWRREITRTVVSQTDPTLVPIAKFGKGTVLGALRVEVDGKRARTLRYSETMGVLVAGVDGQWDRTFSAKVKPSAVRQTNDQSQDLRKRVLMNVCSTEQMTTKEYKALTDEVKQLADKCDASPTEANRLMLLLNIALLTQVVFAYFTPTTGGRYSRVALSYYPHEPRDGITTATERFRAAVGLGKRHYDFNLPGVVESPSYHLDLTGPEGMYVYSARTTWAESTATPRPPYTEEAHRVRVQVNAMTPPSGTENAHLYMRDYDGLLFPDPLSFPRLVVQFREIPPGLIGPTLLASWWLTFLVWIVAVFYSVVFPAATGSQSGLAGAWPTLLFGVQAVVVGWLISRMSSSTLRALSIPSFLVIMGLVLNAAAVLTVVALKSAGIEGDPLVFDVPVIGTQTINNPTWTALMFSVAMNSVIATFMYVTKNTRFASIVNGKD